MINTKYFYFKTNQWHHLYTGIIIALLSLFIKVYVGQIILWTFGWILIADDLGQHIMQGVLQNSNYHTPWHYAGRPFYVLRKWLIKKYPNLKWLGTL